MLTQPIKIAIVDDHALFRKTLKAYLDGQSEFNVPVLAEDIVDLFSKLKEFPVDIIIMDFFLPHMNGNEGVKAVRLQYPKIKMIMLSMSTDLDIISDLLDDGVYGYISKVDEPEELRQAILSASNDMIYRNRIYTEALYWNKHKIIKTPKSETSIFLSDREKQIIRLLWDEKTNKEIADEIFLSIRSVEKIRQDMKDKLGVKSTVGLLKYAIKKKIVGINSQVPG
jgi:DNA-binding NarL/FixJ family response regulator